MKINFNEYINEGYDKYDGSNLLSEETLKKIHNLVNDIENEIPNMFNKNLSINKIDDISTKYSITLKINIMNELNLFNLIYEYIYYTQSKHNFDVSRSNDKDMYLIVKENDNTFKIPIIINVSGDDFIYSNSNEIRYSVWINTYVTKKI